MPHLLQQNGQIECRAEGREEIQRIRLIDIALWKGVCMCAVRKGHAKWVSQRAFTSIHMPYLCAPPLPTDLPSVCFSIETLSNVCANVSTFQ